MIGRGEWLRKAASSGVVAVGQFLYLLNAKAGFVGVIFVKLTPIIFYLNQFVIASFHTTIESLIASDTPSTPQLRGHTLRTPAAARLEVHPLLDLRAFSDRISR